MMKTYFVYYEGKVQKVGFRATVLGLARGYDVVGGVRNLADGRVELQVRGEEEEIADFLIAVRESSLAGHITSEKPLLQESSLSVGWRGFHILA